MAKPLELSLPTGQGKRVLVVARDPWLRFRLQRELEQAGCEVDPLAELSPGQQADFVGHDVILTDASIFPEEHVKQAVRELRRQAAQSHFVLVLRPEEKALEKAARLIGFDLVLEQPQKPQELPGLVRQALRTAAPAGARGTPVSVRFDFVMGAMDSGKRKAGSAVTSLVVHMLVLIMAVLVPLMYTESLDVRQFAQTWLMAPPPPPPLPPPAAQMAPVRRVRTVSLVTQGKLVAPTRIPTEVKIIEEPQGETESFGGVVGGVPGGVPGGQMGGVLGGVLGGIPSPVVRPPAPVVTAPVRVGGKVRPPQLLRRLEPVYPNIGKQARIQGVVRIDAVIDAQGNVVEMKVLSGHPLLVQAALATVRQWKYAPTYLNEQPIPVVLEVTINFTLN